MKNGKAILICAIFSFIFSAVLWFFITIPFKDFRNAIDTLPQLINTSLVGKYPEDLVVSINKGVITTNQPSPFCIILDDKTKAGIVYDSSATSITLNALDQDGPYQDLCLPYALVGQTFVMYPDKDSGQIRINKIPTDITYEIKKSTIVTFVDNILPIIVQVGNIGYYLVPLFIFIAFFCFTLLTNFWYTFVSKLVLRLFKINPTHIKGMIYGTSLFIFNIIQFINLVLFDWLINKASHRDYTLSFPFSKTIIISIGTLIYFKYLSTTPPLPSVSEAVSTTPTPAPNQPMLSPNSSIETPTSTDSSPPKSIHVDLTSPTQSPPDNDPNPPPRQE